MLAIRKSKLYSDVKIQRLAIICLVMCGFITLSLKTSMENVGEETEEKKQGDNSILIDRIHCQVNDVLPSGGFCLSDHRIFTGHNQVWEGKLCKALEDLFGYSTVADFGAGLGHYGRCFLRHDKNFIVRGNEEERSILTSFYRDQLKAANLTDKPQVIKSWHGYDGADNIEKMTGGKIHKIDLATSFDLRRRFDWVLTLEVGEHIPAENEAVFMDNVVQHACEGVVMSWAVPGQKGHHHVNNQPNDYVIRKMEERGMKHDPKSEERIRTSIDFYWFKDTVMVFRFPAKRC